MNKQNTDFVENLKPPFFIRGSEENSDMWLVSNGGLDVKSTRLSDGYDLWETLDSIKEEILSGQIILIDHAFTDHFLE